MLFFSPFSILDIVINRSKLSSVPTTNKKSLYKYHCVNVGHRVQRACNVALILSPSLTRVIAQTWISQVPAGKIKLLD